MIIIDLENMKIEFRKSKRIQSYLINFISAYRERRFYDGYPGETVRRTTYTTDPYSTTTRVSPTRDYNRSPRYTGDVVPKYGSTDTNPYRDVSLIIEEKYILSKLERKFLQLKTKMKLSSTYFYTFNFINN